MCQPRRETCKVVYLIAKCPPDKIDLGPHTGRRPVLGSLTCHVLVFFRLVRETVRPYQRCVTIYERLSPLRCPTLEAPSSPVRGDDLVAPLPLHTCQLNWAFFGLSLSMAVFDCVTIKKLVAFVPQTAVKMHLMYYLDDQGTRVYSLKVTFQPTS